MRDWYFFNDEPEQQQKYNGLDPNSFPSEEALLSFLRYRPAEFDRGFSFTTTLAEDSQFFGEGVFIGFGFGSKFVDSPTNNDLRITQVIAGSPADLAGMLRGQRILTIDGRSIADINLAEGVTNALGASDEGVSRTFLLRTVGGNEFAINLDKTEVTLVPVPFSTVFDIAGAKVGYLDFPIVTMNFSCGRLRSKRLTHWAKEDISMASTQPARQWMIWDSNWVIRRRRL